MPVPRRTGGSRDATWLPGHAERGRRWRPPAGARITARPAAPRPARGGHRGGVARHRRADRRLVREVAAAAGRGHRRAAPDRDHGHGRLPGPHLVGRDARRGVPGDAVRRVPERPVIEFRVIEFWVIEFWVIGFCGGRGRNRVPGVHIEAGRRRRRHDHQRRAARRDRRPAAVRAGRPGARVAGPDARRDRAGRDRAAAGPGLARLLRQRGYPGTFGPATEYAVYLYFEHLGYPRRPPAACQPPMWSSCPRCPRRSSR